MINGVTDFSIDLYDSSGAIVYHCSIYTSKDHFMSRKEITDKRIINGMVDFRIVLYKDRYQNDLCLLCVKVFVCLKYRYVFTE